MTKLVKMFMMSADEGTEVQLIRNQLQVELAKASP
jgi:hypothetical protein